MIAAVGYSRRHLTLCIALCVEANNVVDAELAGGFTAVALDLVGALR